MKTTILLFAVIFGYITPTYSQIDPDNKTDAGNELFRNYDFGNYKFDIPTGSWSNKVSNSFNMLPTRFASIKSTVEISPVDKMPCFHPKSGDRMPMPWFKPTDTFSPGVFKPKNVTWGILF